MPTAVKINLIFIASMLAFAVAGFALVWTTTDNSEDKALVIKVCRDGTLVLKMDDGSFRAVRPGAWRGWRVDGSDVCK